MNMNSVGISVEISRLDWFRRSLAAHAIYILPLTIVCLGDEVLHQLRPEIGPAHLQVQFLLALVSLIPLLLFGLSMMRFYHLAVYTKPDKPLRALFKEMKLFLSTPQRIAQGVPALLVVALIGAIFSDIQSNTLILQPNTWDTAFAAWDKAIHFGRHPWEWLMPIFGNPYITFVLNLNYNLWYITMMTLLIYFGFARVSSLARTRFLLAFIGIWTVTGSILSIVFASAGPCYYSRLGLSPDPYTDLMAYLRHANDSIPIWAVTLQDHLWELNRNHIDGGPVSAMPSLHNGSALLFALAGYQISKFWGRVLSVHAAFIFLGSFFLAWHYAIDAYVAWAMTLIIWFASAPIARWWHRTVAQKQFDLALNG